MARTPTVRYFNSRKAYYCQFQGKQHCLAVGPKDEPNGPTYQKATLAFARLVHVGDKEEAPDGTSVTEVISCYCFRLKKDGREKVHKLTRRLLDPCLAEFGELRVRDLKPVHVRDWLDKMRVPRRNKKGKRIGWSASTCKLVLTKLHTAFNWAVSERLITKNPLHGMKTTYKSGVRGEAFCLPPELQDLLIRNASTHFALALRLLRRTGARPGEILNAEAFHYRREIGAFVYRWNATEGYVWKNARKTEKDRVVFVPADLRPEVEAMIVRHPRGFLFRTPRGKEWTSANVYETLRTLRRKKPVADYLRANGLDPDKVILYAFRHSYITDWLKSGRSIKIVAELCGTSVSMIERHYAHLSADLDNLQRLAAAFDQRPQ